MTEEGVVTLLRRYSVESDAWEPFLETWRKIATIRQRHGFEVVCAFVDREANMFTWAISYRGEYSTGVRVASSLGPGR
jgi:hypothetical protein